MSRTHRTSRRWMPLASLATNAVLVITSLAMGVGGFSAVAFGHPLPPYEVVVTVVALWALSGLARVALYDHSDRLARNARQAQATAPRARANVRPRLVRPAAPVDVERPRDLAA